MLSRGAPPAALIPFRGELRHGDRETGGNPAGIVVSYSKIEDESLVALELLDHFLDIGDSLAVEGAILIRKAGAAGRGRGVASASRFTLEGDGGFTVVAGEKLRMSRGDLVLTPNGTWHDHGNDGSEPVIWVDVLNVPLVESLDATCFEFDYAEADPSNGTSPVPRTVQTVREPAEHSQNLYGSAGLMPLFISHRRGPTEHSPMFIYRWGTTRQALERLRDYAGSPYDGLILEYVDPTTGGP